MTESAAAEPAAPRHEGVKPGWPDKPLHQYTAEEYRRHVVGDLVERMTGAKKRRPPFEVGRLAALAADQGRKGKS